MGWGLQPSVAERYLVYVTSCFLFPLGILQLTLSLDGGSELMTELFEQMPLACGT